MTDCKREIVLSIPNNNCCSHCFVKTLFFVCAEKTLDGFVVHAPNLVLKKLEAIVHNFYPELKLEINNDCANISGNCYQLLLDIDFLNINLTMLDDCCLVSMLKTLFVLCGRLNYNVDDSKNSKGYILEISLSEKLVPIVSNLLDNFGFKFAKKQRNSKTIFYTKNSALICDFLVKVDAVECSFEIQNSLVMREVRNTANRQNNCFEHNLDKTIGASTLQLEAINYIISKQTIDYLDENLKEVALLRLANPDVSLNELKTLLGKNISRAGLKYRLDKIVEIYKKLKGENK